jgi:hypothetical protein
VRLKSPAQSFALPIAGLAGRGLSIGSKTCLVH